MKHVASLILIVMLAACGGGSADGDQSSPAPNNPSQGPSTLTWDNANWGEVNWE
jgi:hypothetical protein